ncbi:MAG: hypothetical protein A3H01_00555 [Candidatus Wildermuthbacteria bacterium RIFCSPLOWO2_12_FULL_40_9]|uniref:histidine kinase n=1 Tax=Candidatus Wildermuthbacteria bacterium RIFCSPLOWO2_12_FULL_40_9 TaxID=1802467 RepID=A0A1G2RWQ5_9BACT|nr:MAG: hypothetical protein A3H01_00555 [Candidatus Wildermuthbacteria bacterium RIFCSPLOWO2_12_FULL_40_9]
MTIELAYTIIPIFAILFLGILVLFHDRKSITNAFFFLICISTVLWSISNYLSLTVSPNQSLFWIRMVIFFAAPHAVLFLLFIYNFPHRNLIIKRIWFIVSLFTLGFTMMLTASPFIFSRTEIKNGSVIPIPGPLMPFFALVILLSLISALTVLVFKYRHALNIEKRQWGIMLLGTSLSYILIIITNFLLVILFSNTEFIILGPIFMLPTFIGMSYAALRYHLFNFKAIAVEIFTFIILSISLFEAFIARSTTEIALRIALFVLFFVFGIMLIRGVLREVEQREKLAELNRQLETAYIELDNLSKAKSEFISIASHQLRTPLTAIKGYISMIIEGSYGKFSDKAKKPLENVYKSNERLVNLVNDLLSISRIESGKMKFEPEPASIEEIIEDVIFDLRINAEKKNLYLNFEKPAMPLPNIQLDKTKTRDIILNLVDNAIKYTNDGGIAIKLKIQNSNLKIEIKDTGEGMEKYEIEKIFESFSRGTVGIKAFTEGAGLGLYIARKYAEMHGGRVWAESEGKGKGSTFIVEVPAR